MSSVSTCQQYAPQTEHQAVQPATIPCLLVLGAKLERADLDECAIFAHEQGVDGTSAVSVDGRQVGLSECGVFRLELCAVWGESLQSAVLPHEIQVNGTSSVPDMTVERMKMKA